MKENKALIAHLSMFGACAGWGLMAPIGKDAMTAWFRRHHNGHLPRSWSLSAVLDSLYLCEEGICSH